MYVSLSCQMTELAEFFIVNPLLPWGKHRLKNVGQRRAFQLVLDKAKRDGTPNE